ncbi:hypothetical protein ACFSTC_51010 [Nonomuraea ferruginea]
MADLLAQQGAGFPFRRRRRVLSRIHEVEQHRIPRIATWFAERAEGEQILMEKMYEGMAAAGVDHHFFPEVSSHLPTYREQFEKEHLHRLYGGSMRLKCCRGLVEHRLQMGERSAF